MTDLTLININLNTAQSIDRVCDTCPADCHIIRNIQIKIHVQHIDRLQRTALCISGICFVIAVITNIQIRITVDGNKLDFLCCLINGSNNDRIGSVALAE